ncbi:MAG: hypothetical protein EXR30_01110 [Betaproteobacteria bacterium]|nr:hypothetical protein [Betaproteobacteria bacterium]MSQ88982.1 hypothetical protein [Betaproteobacteria bacterium]
MSHQPVIDGLEFARTGLAFQGTWPVSAFLRLCELLRTEDGTLHYELRGVPEKQGRLGLKLKVDGALQLVCQRCLGALELALRIDVSLQLAATQAEVDAEPLTAEGPERIVAGREMPVRDLVEDEVLLALPLAPRHERCAGGQAQALQDEEKSPFAVLRGLVSGSKH